MALNLLKNKFKYSIGQNNNGITFAGQHEIYGFTRFSYRNELAINFQTRRHFFFLNIFYTLPRLLLKRTTILRCVLNNKDAIILISRPTRMKKKNNNNETKKTPFLSLFLWNDNRIIVIGWNKNCILPIAIEATAKILRILSAIYRYHTYTTSSIYRTKPVPHFIKLSL